MLKRGCAGSMALGGLAALLSSVWHGAMPEAAWAQVSTLVVFGLYAIGGQPLLERWLPMFRTKPPPERPPDDP